MSELERNMESFKRLIFRRLENYENTFESRLKELELSRSQSNANEVIELQNVISIFLYYLSNIVRKFFISVKIA
jgi:hypothetical protein